MYTTILYDFTQFTQWKQMIWDKFSNVNGNRDNVTNSLYSMLTFIAYTLRSTLGFSSFVANADSFVWSATQSNNQIDLYITYIKYSYKKHKIINYFHKYSNNERLSYLDIKIKFHLQLELFKIKILFNQFFLY